MKNLKVVTLLIGLLFLSCNKSNQEETIVDKEAVNTVDIEKEGAKIQELLKNLYKWHELVSSKNDFSPQLENTSDSSYTGLEIYEFKRRIDELNRAVYFSRGFIENYYKIGKTIDAKLRAKELVWEVGGFPPFGNGANPWCNCQDVVADYWDILTINNLEITDNIATLDWTWGGDFSYKVKTIKNNERWEVLYLEGFDIDNFLPAQ